MVKRKKYKNIEGDENNNSSAINWFPGHMAKALQQVKENLKKVNIVLEIRDARAPLASGNPSLDEVCGQKNRLVILNKVNLANPENVLKWEKYFHDNEIPFFFANSFDDKNVKALLTKAKNLVLEKKSDSSAKVALKMMVVGLPNTGKSTLINHLSKRKATRAADKPGLTQNQQWVNISKGIDLLDTPGIMSPQIKNEEQGLWLSAIHAIKDDIVGEDRLAFFLAKFFIEQGMEQILDYYKIDLSKKNSISLPEDLLEAIALQRNYLVKGGIADLNRVYATLIKDFRKGDLGQFSFESPEFSDKDSPL